MPRRRTRSQSPLPFGAENERINSERKPIEVSGRTFTLEYLLKLLEENPDHGFQNNPRIQNAFQVLCELYKKELSKVSNYNETELEDEFIKPILSRALGFNIKWMTRRKNITIAGASIQPDLVLFPSEADYNEALQFRDSEPETYFRKALCIVESELWGKNPFQRPQETRRGSRRDSGRQTSEKPYNQILRYLHTSGIPWGILTNGAQWVLVPKDQPDRSPTYILFNLLHILENPANEESLKAFSLFVFLLEKEAFAGRQERGSRLDQIRAQNLQRQAQVEAGLHARVYPALLAFSQGLHDYLHSNGHSLAPEDGKNIYSASLYLLYRLLFIFYAESRGLLRIGDQRFSLMKIRENCREVPVEWTPRGNRISMRFAEPRNSFKKNTYCFHGKLAQLFRFIDEGDQDLELPGYNGDLFKQKNWPEGPDNLQISDYHIGIALHFLGYRHEQGQLLTVDYHNLGVRQLGAIYEHLLIFSEPKVATSDTSVEWHYPEPEENGRTRRKAVTIAIPAGSVYFEPEPSRRKGTGTYYTPEYIVRYIVENTLGPLMDEREKEFKAVIDKIAQKNREANSTRSPRRLQEIKQEEIPRLENEALDTLLRVRVCDPAMGSGHFLVDACDFITRQILEILEKYSDSPVENKINELRNELLNHANAKGYQLKPEHLTTERLIQRLVLKRCIYGVDLNPLAVELAKLSLWLHCFTEGAPLSFLDHHLKCGNSLIGARYEEIQEGLWQVGLFNQIPAYFPRITGMLKVISELTDVTMEEVGESVRKYKESEDLMKPARRLFDAWTAEYFGHRGIQESLKGAKEIPKDWDKVDGNALPDWFCEGLREARNRRFFHWELEFPEAFFDAHGFKPKEERGFDAVIGNPPYGIVFDEDEKAFWEWRFPSFVRNNDLYVAFMEFAVLMCSVNRSASMIVPNTFIFGPYFTALRRFLREHAYVVSVVDFGTTQIFDDPNVFNAIFMLQRQDLKTGSIERKASFYQATQQSGRVQVLSHTEIDVDSLKDERWKIEHPVVLKMCAVGDLTMDEVALVKDVGFNYWTIGRGKKRGGSIGSRVLYEGERQHPGDIPYLKGSDFDRYEPVGSNEHWLRYSWESLIDSDVDIFRFSPQFLRVPKKIVYRQTSDKLIGSIDTSGLLVDKTVHVVLLREGWQRFSYEYLLAIFNSTLANFAYLDFAQEEGRTFAQVKTFNVKRLPIRRITFTTPSDERARLVEEGKRLYNEMVEKMTRR